MTDLSVLAISGSLRRASFNSAALRACQTLAPAGMVIDIFEGIGDIPHFNGDDESSHGIPPAAMALRERMAAADALLIATPEYNSSLPGALKNAIDWASRAPEPPVMRKSVAIFGASMGGLGTARAQGHLRSIFVGFDAVLVNNPQVFIGQAHTKFDAAGTLTDTPTATILTALLTALREQTLRLRAARAAVI